MKSPSKARLKLLSIALFAALFLVGAAPHASAQARGRAGGGGGGRAVASGGVRAPSPAVVGRAVPRAGYPGRPISGYPYRGYSPYYRGYYPYYGGYYPYYYGSRFSLGIGLGFGYPYWGYYPYGYYGYYGNPYLYGGYPYYGGYGAYGGYYGVGSVGTTEPVAYGGVRIQGAPRDAQVYADGYYVGIVDDFNGVTQHLNLQAGVHKIELRMAGQPPIEFDVNVQPGQTITYHAGITR